MTGGVDGFPSGTMLDAWELTTSAHGDSVALYFGPDSLTFVEVDRRADAMAVALQSLGVLPGDRVGILLQNDPEWYIAMIAIWKVGGSVVPVNPMYTSRELTHTLLDSGARVIFCGVEFSSVLEDVTREVKELLAITIDTGGRGGSAGSASAPSQGPARGSTLAARGWEDLLQHYGEESPAAFAGTASVVAVLTYTSGTTGPAKGAMNLHRNLMCSAENYTVRFDLSRGDVVLVLAPLFHVTGLVAGLAVGLLKGLPVVLLHRFDAVEAVAAIERYRPTFTVGTTTSFLALSAAASGRDLSSLTKIGSGGAPLSASVVARVREATGLRLRGVFGLTETTGPTHIAPAGVDAPVDPATGIPAVGHPVPDVEVRIVDLDTGEPCHVGQQGEIVVRGPMVVPGYWANRDATAGAIVEDWFWTGDIGYVDEQNWLFVVDRKKDLIIASGYKVWPREVEDILQEHPAVEQAAVVGVPDSYRGETVKAFVVLRSGAEATTEELIEHSRQRLASYKYPRSLEIVAALPENASGKILRRSLRDATR